MIINKIIKLITLIFFSVWTAAQTSVVSGKVVDEASGAAFHEAQIVFTQEGTSKAELFTDENGNFQTTLPKGKYTLFVENFGFIKKSQTVDIKEATIDLGTFSLKKAFQEKSLDNVTVVGKKTTIVNQIDRKVVTVGDDLASASVDLSQVMNTIPGVFVDQDNNISLRGDANVKVLVDGKPSNVSFEQLMRQYPPSEIERIEVLTNPPAKYSPEGKSGIINIVLKKGKRKGTNITLNTSYMLANKSKHNTSVNFNQGLGKVNIFGSGNYGEYTFNNYGKLYNEVTDYMQDMSMDGKWINRNGKIGMDYFINDKNTLSVYTGRFHGNGDMPMESHLYYVNDSSKENRYLSQNQKEDWKGQEYDAFYKKEFSKSGHTLEFNANYGQYDGESYRDSDPQTNIGASSTQEKAFRGAADYALPLSETSELTAGVEVRANRRNQDYTEDDYISVLGPYFFDFKRDIYSAYAEYKKNWDRFGVKAGLRGEYVKTTTASDYVDALGTRAGGLDDKQTQLYPTLHLSYKVGKEKKTELALSYSRRVDRPWMDVYSPFPGFVMGTTVQVGSDKIKPEYTNSVEASVSRNFEKLYFGLSVYYRNIQDEINQVIFNNPADNITYMMWGNTKGNDRYGSELDLNYNPFKWWSINSGFEFYWGKVSGYTLDEYYTRNTSRFFGRVNNTFNLSKASSIQLFGFYRSKSQDIQGNYNPQWKMDVSVKQAFMDNNLSFTLKLSDIFNTNHSEWEILRPSHQTGEWHWDSSVLSFAVTYNFASGKKIQQIERKQKDDNTKQGGGGAMGGGM
ncbi:MAG: TonB-dependent receptor [Flavobacteriaceae bacterium]|jgi:hypothetical protein|nr:TonB-dependent receptor [Flavobacteriaceae bacterium]